MTDPFYRASRHFGLDTFEPPRSRGADRAVAPALYPDSAGELEDFDPYADLADVDPNYDVYQKQKADRRRRDMMTLQDLNPLSPEGQETLMTVLGRNPSLIADKGIAGLMHFANDAAGKRSAAAARSTAAREREDYRASQLELQQQKIDAAKADQERKVRQSAKLKSLYLLNPGSEDYQDRYDQAVNDLDDEDFSNPAIQGVLKSHEPFRFAPKPKGEEGVPGGLIEKHLGLLQEERADFDPELKAEAFAAKHGKPPVTEADWDEADELLRGPKKQAAKRSAQFIADLKAGRIPGMGEPP